MTKSKAIEHLKTIAIYSFQDGYTDKARQAIDMAIKALEEPERTAHWIDGHCSNCGCDVPAYIIDWKWQKDMDAKYCPNCGYRMEGE